MYYLIIWNNKNGKAYAEVFTSLEARAKYNVECMSQAEPAFKVYRRYTGQEFTQVMWSKVFKDVQFH